MDEKYYKDLTDQVNKLSELFKNPQLEIFEWRYAVHGEVCKLDNIIDKFYEW
jgi:hypothetical protein